MRAFVGLALACLAVAPRASAQQPDLGDDAIFVAPPAPVTRAPTRLPSALVHFTSTDARALTVHQWMDDQWVALCSAPCAVDLTLGTHSLALALDASDPVAVESPAIDGPLRVVAHYDDRDTDRILGGTLIGGGVAIGGGVGGGLLGFVASTNGRLLDDVDVAAVLWADIWGWFAVSVGVALTIGGLVLAGHRRDIWLRDATLRF